MRRNIERSGASRSMMLCCLVAASALTGCGIGRGPYPGVPDFVDASSIPVYKGPVAAPQVAYRIDENRYFEIVPLEAGACTVGRIYYNDKAKGIRSLVMSLKELGGVDLVIDAANDQYLVAPMTRGSINCSSGGGFCSGPKLPYSVDGGRTWKRVEPRFLGRDVYLAGDLVLVSSRGRSRQTARLSQDLASTDAWKEFDEGNQSEPAVQKDPVDTKFHCASNGKE